MVKHTHLSLEALDQVTNGHTGGDGMGIDDNVRGNPLTGERHILWNDITIATLVPNRDHTSCL